MTDPQDLKAKDRVQIAESHAQYGGQFATVVRVTKNCALVLVDMAADDPRAFAVDPVTGRGIGDDIERAFGFDAITKVES